MNQKYKQNFLQAGALAREARAFGKSLIRKGASYNEVIAKINEKILSLGARPAFPPQIALNDVAAHFLPQLGEDRVFADEVVKLDIGVCHQGAIGDCAVTIDLSGQHQNLIDAVEAALLAAEQTIEAGIPVREIGKLIEQTIASYGLAPVKNLAGHGLGYYKIHTPPQIPNYADKSTAVIKKGMTFAIEPFATNGKGLISESGAATIFSYLGHRPTRSEEAKNLLKKIKSYDGLPFAIHNLYSENLAIEGVKKGIDELLSSGAIAGYPPLVEVERGLVAQAENSILVDENGKVYVTTR